MKDKLEAMELKPNMYVRTNDGYISNVNNINDKNIYNNNFLKLGIIKKSSYDIIDLIEEGDYVNGKIVISIYEQDNKYYQYGKEFITHDKMIMYGDMASVCKLENLQIKSIVTKEQFSSIEYRLGDE